MRRVLLSTLFLTLGMALAGCNGMYSSSSPGGGSSPSITSLNPTLGAVGTSVTITGTNFGSTQGYSTVAFNGTAATPTSWSATSIVAPVPTGATTGNVVVTVGGTASNGMSFTVTAAAPNITSLNPTSGPVGTSVTITGTNFGSTQGASTVKFNGTAATPTSWSATSIVAPVPTGATTGNVVVAVGGTGSNGVSFTVTSTAPSIASLNPPSGSVGTSVTITGTNFGASQGTSTVTFKGTAATPTSWGATSIAAPVPTGATTGNVVVTVGGTASNGVTFTVTTGATKFPIKASANNRYFVDQNGTPWMMVADAAHHLMPAIPQSAVAAYLTDRVNHGFNAIDFYFMCAGAGTCPASGAAFDGTLPFTSGTGPSSYDLSTPNSAYWAEVDSVISQAAADGLVVFVNPIPWGVAFSSTLQNNGATKDFAFGQFIGNRYKNTPNIIWHVGQDFQSWNSSSSDLNDEAQLMAGILSSDPNHLLMSQLSYPVSYSSQANALNSTFAANLNSNFVYSYHETYDEVLQAYNSGPTLPNILGEANYENGNNLGLLSSAADAFITRMEMWWPMTSGATGFEFGNEDVNHFDSSYLTNLDTTATTQVKYVQQLLSGFNWWTFAPDQTHAVVTSGYGTYNGTNGNLYNARYATTTWDGSTTSITYTPVSTTLTVNMAKFSASSVAASWYDPTTGTSTPIGSFANGGTQTFTTPTTAHADGTHDWVLVLDPPTNTTPTAPTITTPPVNQTVTAGQTATFTVTANGTAPLSYQWQKNGASIAGATSASYTTPATTTSDSGSTFDVVVSNSAGTATSNAATLTVNPAPAPAIQINPTSINFGNVVVGTTLSQSLIISNTGTATLSITQITVTGATFSASGYTLPLSVNAGQQTTITVAFLPTAVPMVSGSISIASNAPTSPTSVGLSGSGIAATFTLGINPTSLSFGNVLTGTSSATQNVTITNTGNSNVRISQISVTAGYSVTGGSTPVTLTPSQILVLGVQFSPTATGSLSGTISITSNATGSPAAVTLLGNGVVQHSVTLSWIASTSTVAGYNVYRSTTSGSGYVKVNSSLVIGLTYTDSSVGSGTTYFYVATAVDSSGNESAFSNQTTAVIP